MQDSHKPQQHTSRTHHITANMIIIVQLTYFNTMLHFRKLSRQVCSVDDKDFSLTNPKQRKYNNIDDPDELTPNLSMHVYLSIS